VVLWRRKRGGPNMRTGLLCCLSVILIAGGMPWSNSVAETPSMKVNSPAKGLPVLLGLWGGESVAMQVTSQGASLEFGCGSGEILRPLVTTAKGRFAVRGTYRPEHGGPARRGALSGESETVYLGTISENTMVLTFKLSGDQEPQGPFTLRHGHAGHLIKCQ